MSVNAPSPRSHPTANMVDTAAWEMVHLGSISAGIAA